MPGFVLYYRERCHLCESMRLALQRLQQHEAIHWDEVDIDGDINLIREYDVLVPVLTLDGQEICHHFYDEQAVRAALQLSQSQG